MSEGQGLLHSQRIRALVSRHLSSPGGIESVENPVLMELVTMVHHGGTSEILNAVKEPLKHGVPEIQRRVLTLIDRLVLNTPPEFALCLATDDWAERLFRTTKTTAAPEVADRVMVLVLDWHKRYPIDGLRQLLERFENSKVVGDRFRFIKNDFERRQQQLRAASSAGTEASPSPERQSSHGRFYDPTAAGDIREAPHSRRQRVNLDTLLMDVQGDMAGLEYGIQHPDMLDAQTARDCAKHRATLSRVIDNPANVISDDEREQVLLILEQLVNLLSFHDALMGTKFAEGMSNVHAPAQRRTPPRQQQRPSAADQEDVEMRMALQASMVTAARESGVVAGDSSDAAASPDDDGARESLTHRQASGMHSGVFASAAELDAAKRRGDDLTAEKAALEVKLRTIDTERSDLQAELKAAEAEIEKLKEKYNNAKTKNKEAVAAVEEMDGQLADAHERISTLETALKDHQVAPPPPPEIREVVKVVKQTLDPQAVQRVRDAVQTLKKDNEKLKRTAERTFGSTLETMMAEMKPRLEGFLSSNSQEREKHAQEIATLSALYKREMKRRKEYYNQIQELKGNIRVYCRFRPMSETELKNGHQDVATFPADDEVRIIDDKQRVKNYEFDSVFGPSSTQEQVFEDTKPLIEQVVDGYNVCIFAYGQTGSGKTHTMNGTVESPGINRRALERLFEVIAERTDTEESEVHVSVLEIYNDQIRDLLVPKKNLAKSYDIHPNGKYGHYVSNLTEEVVTNADAIAEIMARASGNRAEGATNMNAHSSRSHMVVYILITTTNKTTGAQSYGKLSLVDLAGSERLDKSGAEGAAAKEAVSINKSLTALGDTIAALSQSAKHVPYRNSTLTHLLQDSMSGQAKVLMFCCASPASYNTQETISSLTFALRARGVSLGQVKKNA